MEKIKAGVNIKVEEAKQKQDLIAKKSKNQFLPPASA